MNRRGFLSFLGVATAASAVPAVPAILDTATAKPAEKQTTKPPVPIDIAPPSPVIKTPSKLVRLLAKEKFDEVFATSLEPGRMCVSFLWTRNRGQGSSIVIEKEIWCDVGLGTTAIGGRWQERRCEALGVNPDTELPIQFPVFHLYNYVDPSKMHRPGWSGCRTSPRDESYLDLMEAIEQAVEFTEEALESGKWETL